MKYFVKDSYNPFKTEKFIYFFSLMSAKMSSKRKKNIRVNKKPISAQQSLVNFVETLGKLLEKIEIEIVIANWIRISNIKLGWIHDFDKLVVKYVMFSCFLHTGYVWGIDYSIVDGNHLLCSGSEDNTVCVCDVEKKEQIRLFNEHLGPVYCVKFSSYHCRNVICSSSYDKTIRFWDFKHNRQLKTLNEHTGWIGCIEFSSFNGGRYLCSGSRDKNILLWDVETYKVLHVFKGHKNTVRCLAISPLQSYSSSINNNKSNKIGTIGGNGHTICSGSYDNTIRIWDIETTKQLNIFRGHRDQIMSVKYGSNELGINGGANTVLSGSYDKSVRLWDIRSGQQIQEFYGHKYAIFTVEYSPFVGNNIEVSRNSNVICSGSADNTICFWDIRSNKQKLYVIKGSYEDKGIACFKFLKLKTAIKSANNPEHCVSLCYGSYSGFVRIWQ
ncbi:WD-40 repeat protein [Reticulomyxa filosa]|uniref:WD-40 repeat protein n=1 Tax=Reticulomyxa filosa TaxID=46433 RepID=X6MFJ2_RETFI|nr:WD-40 repeat protein [Reticulomyxa filosa]|eukprot:ETO11810.1 WD-40 repeat protein [Reticulomyxa filosa]